jgi:hypothetical protein
MLAGISICNFEELIIMKAIPLKIILLSILALVSGCKNGDGNPVGTSGGGLADPFFKNVSANWYNQVFKLRMDNIWQSQGISAKGQNYYFIAKPTQSRSYSDRFNPESNYFQAWFGAYTIEDLDNTTYALANYSLDAKAIFQISIADQIAWLQSFAGLSLPTVSIDTSVALNISQIQIDSRPGWKVTGRLISNVDVGVNNPTSNYPSLFIIPTKAWQGLVESYANIKLVVVSYVWYAPENKELNIVYYNGVDFIDSNGVHHSTLNEISAELDSMAYSVTVLK